MVTINETPICSHIYCRLNILYTTYLLSLFFVILGTRTYIVITPTTEKLRMQKTALSQIIAHSMHHKKSGTNFCFAEEKPTFCMYVH